MTPGARRRRAVAVSVSPAWMYGRAIQPSPDTLIVAPSNASWIEEIEYQYLGAALPTARWGTFSAGAFKLDYGRIQGFTDGGLQTNPFSVGPDGDWISAFTLDAGAALVHTSRAQVELLHRIDDKVHQMIFRNPLPHIWRQQ